MNILIVEDDNISALVLRKALERLGHEVTVQSNGENGLSALENAKYSILISDWIMPKMDGLDLCRNVRKHSDLSSVYIIMLTARGLPEDRVVGLEAGADDFLVKPLDQGELVARLEVARRIIAMREQITSSTLQLKRIESEIDRNTSQLGEILVAKKFITRQVLLHALELQTENHRPIGRILTENGWLDEEHITEALAMQMDVPYASVLNELPDPFVLSMVPYETAKKNLILPLGVTHEDDTGPRRLSLAMTNPWDIEAIDMVQRMTRYRIVPMLASKEALERAIERSYNYVQEVAYDAEMTESLLQASSNVQITDELMAELDESELIRQSDEAPVIRFVNTLFVDAARRRASDIHIEPGRRNFSIRYRIDGHLKQIRTVPRQFLAPTISRIKIMSDMDIAERRLPLDGRLTLAIEGKSVDFRISTMANKYGERMVVRILNRTAANMSLDSLNLSASNNTVFQSMLQKPHGIILVTGPTGAGKTTTLYAALNALKTPTTNIMTCEDPVEYELEGVNQFGVNERIGLTFAKQLRAILRQDPDIILVGEIRDAETAEIAIRAAMTGHLVFSTLHCNEASSAPSRLIDLGVAPYLLAETLIGVVSQRLVRLLCPACRRQYPPSSDVIRRFEELGAAITPEDVFYSATGCSECDNVGSKGRLAIHEVFEVSTEVKAAIKSGGDVDEIRSGAALSGMRSIVLDGVAKAREGLTVLDDVAKHGSNRPKSQSSLELRTFRASG